MRQNDGILADARLLGQSAATPENRALHRLSEHYPLVPGMDGPHALSAQFPMTTMLKK